MQKNWMKVISGVRVCLVDSVRALSEYLAGTRWQTDFQLLCCSDQFVQKQEIMEGVNKNNGLNH
jgi:hypothetical protein